MTLRHLKIFIAVYQEMSITKAANRLHLAQPSVSLAIKELEDNYHFKLFDRINRRIFVTEVGEAFYEYAFHIISLYDEMENKMISPQMPIKICLGSSITIGTFIVPEIINAFSNIYPNCELNVKIQNSQQIIHSVVKNEMDMGVIEDKVFHEQLIEIPFMEDQLYFICDKNHPLAETEAVSLEEIAAYPLFMREQGSASREIADGLFKAHQLKPHILWESVSNQAILQAIKCIGGITVISEKLVDDDIKKGKIAVLPIYPEVFKRNFALIYHKNKYLTPALNQLIQLFTNHQLPSL